VCGELTAHRLDLCQERVVTRRYVRHAKKP
jgi:hypothetical protein